MAYQLAGHTTDSGITIPAAYLRITDVALQHKGQMAIVSFSVFVSKDAADNARPPIKSDGYAFDGELYTISLRHSGHLR
jgi:hypothetical protein